MKIRKFLGKKIFENKFLYFDYWTVLHFLAFFVLALYYQDQWKLVIMGSVIFEIIEYNMSHKNPFLKEKIKDTINDLSVNFIGYYVGLTYGSSILTWLGGLI